jgi:hypothetical protein
MTKPIISSIGHLKYITLPLGCSQAQGCVCKSVPPAVADGGKLISEIPMTSSRIDEAILSTVGERWMKVARLIVEVAEVMGGSLAFQAERYEAISQRIEALVSDGRLAAQGNIKKWRFSEVRRSDTDQPRNSN